MTVRELLRAVTPKPVRSAIKPLVARLGQGHHGLLACPSPPHVHGSATPQGIGVIFDNPSEMSVDERMFLYAIIRGRRPDRALEIGTYHGGSAAIIASAMEENGKGLVIGVDPAPDVTVSLSAFHGRFRLVSKPSPEATAEASEVAGGPFDFVLIDSIHIYDQLKKDIDGCLPYLSEDAYVLCHDAFHLGVAEGIREALEAHDNLHDCGYVCATPDMQAGVVAYGGFRMLRVGAFPVADPQPLIERHCRAAGKPVPLWHRDLLNHDVWYCRAVKPCPFCQKHASSTP